MLSPVWEYFFPGDILPTFKQSSLYVSRPDDEHMAVEAAHDFGSYTAE